MKSARHRVRTGFAALLAAAVLAGCGGESPDPMPKATSTSATTSSPTGVVLDPAMAVDPPGRRKEPLRSADILIFSQEPLSRQMVARVRALPGVSYAAPLSLAQVTIENRALTVAAVDPATYRLFTASELADAQAVWKRVAGGELAITRKLGKRLADKTDQIKLGGSADAPKLHVGALVPEFTANVDAVVNDLWGKQLGMSKGNALLISTGITSPSTLRPKIEKIVDKTASIQSLDVVARLGLDTSVKQTAFLTGGSVAEVVGTFSYTVLGGGRIAPEASWVSSHISTRTMPIIGSMTCNNAIFPQLEAALREILESGLGDEIHPGEYAGCYYPRFIAGSTTLSNHSFGLAIDLNVPGNQRGTVGEMHRGVVAIFKKWGFAWGGDWGWTDPMHFEMNRVVRPG
ncbi:MAG: M15 family metallopeptidase [Nocardioides sp.]|jgi:hypothetical protein